VVLMPLSLAPSQWEPLVPRLSNDYAVIVLGGAHLGIISLLEERARSGYGELIAQVLDRTKVALGDGVLEVGCGSGAVARALANRLGGANPIIATDINPYILSEACALARERAVTRILISGEKCRGSAISRPALSPCRVYYGARGGRCRQDACGTDTRCAARGPYSSPDTRDRSALVGQPTGSK
jgi:hypothetical protein